LHDDIDSAQHYVEESLSLAKKAGLRSQEAQAYEVAARIAIHRNDHDKARRYFQESVRIYQEIEASFNVVLEKSNLAHMERKLGNYESALEYYCETLLAFRNMGQIGAVSHQLECFGFIALAQKQNERALQLFAAANTLRAKDGIPMTPDELTYFNQQLANVRETIDSSRFEQEWSIGTNLTVEEAIELALQTTQMSEIRI
jgi:tetratricopeptide (TPR) repeat protein